MLDFKKYLDSHTIRQLTQGKSGAAVCLLDVFLNTENGKAPQPKYLYFSVPIEVFELLTKANMLGCKFVPVPRNAGYSENPGETEIVNKTLQAMIENQSKTIVRD